MQNIKHLFVAILFAALCIAANAQTTLLEKPNLKVLAIGNSYTNDATDLLKQIARASGSDLSDLCLYKATRGGGSFKSWYDRYYDNDDHAYSIDKVLGGINANVTTGTWEGTDGSRFREALENETWDLIIIHQNSSYAPYYEQWGGTGLGGYLNEFLALLKQLQPQASIGFMLVHSYWDGYGRNKEGDSLERWRLIANSVEQLCEDYDISLLIPYGTAIENLRASSLNNEYDLTRDGTHCCFGLARYAAACCYYESLIAPRSGISVLGNSARYDASAKSTLYPSISVTDQNAPIAQRAAILAVQNWHEVVNPEDNPVTNVSKVKANGAPKMFFSLGGSRSSNLRRGVNIVQDETGRKIKVAK